MEEEREITCDEGSLLDSNQGHCSYSVWHKCFQTVADSCCLRGMGEKKKKGTSCMRCGIWHSIVFSPLEGHTRVHFIMFYLP